MQIYKYIWDESKSQSNLEKHGYPLKFAALIFDDTYHTVHVAKSDKNTGELRLVALGTIEGKLFATIYVEKEDERRIISFHRIEKRKAYAYRSGRK